MKMKAEHFETLKQAVDKALTANPNAVQRYERGEFLRSDKVKDVQARFNGDLLRAAVTPTWICDELYPYLNHSHIQTAMKRLAPKVVRKY